MTSLARTERLLDGAAAELLPSVAARHAYRAGTAIAKTRQAALMDDVEDHDMRPYRAGNFQRIDIRAPGHRAPMPLVQPMLVKALQARVADA